ncbi:UNVERIFIED_ORG: alpha-L-arabinofuranosidase [Heyndrickxia coagulans]
MREVKITLNKDFSVGKFDRKLFGSFIEHMRRVIYTGIYEPAHPLSDEHGFRKEMM